MYWNGINKIYEEFPNPIYSAHPLTDFGCGAELAAPIGRCGFHLTPV